MIKKIVFGFLAILSVSTYSFANQSNITYLIDTPTYSVLDYGSYDLQFRVFSNGGVLSKLNFGIFKTLNLGVAWELSNIIGTGNVVVAVPTLQLKFNIYEGSEKIPGFAIGYDGQGFFYDEQEAEFRQKGKGVYFVFGKEILLPTLNLNIGVNVNDFKDARLIGFVGSSITIIEHSLTGMIECDNIGKGAYTRLNAGLRLWITENFDIDFMVRNLTSDDEERYGCERILKLSYQSRF